MLNQNFFVGPEKYVFHQYYSMLYSLPLKV